MASTPPLANAPTSRSTQSMIASKQRLLRGEPGSAGTCNIPITGWLRMHPTDGLPPNQYNTVRPQYPGLGCHASEIFGRIYTPRSDIPRHLRIGAQRTRTNSLPIDDLGGHDPIRHLRLLHPVHDI